jgi:hypothetical protein
MRIEQGNHNVSLKTYMVDMLAVIGNSEEREMPKKWFLVSSSSPRRSGEELTRFKREEAQVSVREFEMAVASGSSHV